MNPLGDIYLIMLLKWIKRNSMSKIYKFELTISTGEELKDIVSKNFIIYRKKYSYSPMYLVSNDKKVFEVGYFNANTIVCTYKESEITENEISTNKNNDYIRIDKVESVSDFFMGIYSLIQDMRRMKEELK